MVSRNVCGYACFEIGFVKIVQAGIPDYWPIPAHVMNTYCYVMSTFTLPRSPPSPSPYCRHFPGKVDLPVHPGVGEYNARSEEVVDTGCTSRLTNLSLLQVEYKSYYQWVPFVLLLQACLFYTPHALFKLAEGGKVNFLVIQYFSRLRPSSPACMNRAPC